MESKKINQLATSVNPQTSDLTIIGDPVTGVSKKITLLQIANLFATTGTVSSVAVTETGDALTITGSPITSAGTINIGFAGAANQYVRGDGALADFPTSTGGGSSVSYYLNSSVSQGTIGGVAYKELSKEPIIGAGTDISISANGYIASYITDANDPALLEVPGGNFNCELYFSVNSNAHNPYIYAELYKYDGTTFTLLGSSVAVPEYLTNGTTISPYYFAIPVPTSALTITDRLAIRIYANVDTRTVTLHTENSHLCQVVTTFSKGLNTLNNLTKQVQFLATGTSGTNFNIVSSGDTHTFNLPVASATNTGKLSNTDWSTFNNKLSTATAAATYVPYTGATTNVDLGNNDFTALGISGIAIEAKLNGTGSSPLILRTGTSGYSYGNDSISLISSPTSANTLTIVSDVSLVTKIAQIGLGSLTATRTFTLPDASGTIALTSQLTGGTVTSVGLSSATSGVTIGSSPITTSGTITLTIATASGSQNGLLSSTDWTTFNGKQAALTNPITGTGTRTINYLPIFSGSDTTIANSAITDNGTTVTLISRALSGTTATFSGLGTFYQLTMTGATAGRIFYAQTGGVVSQSGNLNWNETNGMLGVGTPNPSAVITAFSNNAATQFKAAGTAPAFTFSNTLTSASLACVFGLATSSNHFITGTAAGDMAIANQSTVAGAIVFGTGTTERMRVSAAGNFGIGTGNPSNKLTISNNGNAAVAFRINDTNANASFLSLNASNTDAAIIAGGTSAIPFDIYTGGAVRLSIASTGAATFSSSIDVATTARFHSSSNWMQFQQNVLTSQNTDGAHIRSVVSADSAPTYSWAGDTDTGMYTPAANTIAFSTGAVERMRITSGGQIVMGRTTPSGSGRLTVDGDFYLHNITSGAGQSTLKYNYTSTGLVTYDTSSRLLKKDIENLGYGLDDVLKMSAKKYKWKRDDSIDLGFIADEMVEIIPEIVFFSTEMTNETTGVPIGEPLSINYDRLIPVLVKAIQEQQAQIEELKALIAAK